MIAHKTQNQLEHNEKYRHFSPLFAKIDNLLQKKEHAIIAIDGNSGAGKSSLAELLRSVYNCNIFRTDDFFLQNHQRTAERLDEPGGNVDYERFVECVIKPLRENPSIPFSYQVYECKKQELDRTVCVSPKPLSVIEGVYSLHPKFNDIYDIKVFLKVSEAEQSRRLKARNPAMYDNFINIWIPMESKYFSFFNVSKMCDIEFDTSAIPQTNMDRR